MTVKTPSLEEKYSIDRLKQGKLDGMEALVRIYQVQAVYTAYLIVQDLKLAEDIVQDCFLKAATKIDQFDARRSFKPWFLRIVINAAIKTAERQRRFVRLDAEEYECTLPIVDWMLDPKPGPDQIIETEETRQLVWKALGQLSPEQRAAVIMRHFLEMNETEMAQELQRPLTTVRWRLLAARRRLRENLRPFWQTDHPEDDER